MIYTLTDCMRLPVAIQTLLAEIHTSAIFSFSEKPQMTEVPQFYSAANLRNSHASTWK